MKPILKFAACILLTGIIFFASCSKDSPVNNTSYNNPPPPPPPPPSGKAVKVRVVEYGTDLPINGVLVNLGTVPRGNFNGSTDTNGEIWFNENQLGNTQLIATNHWHFYSGQNPNAPAILYPGNIVFGYGSNSVYACDSLLIKLFPITYITLHIKDSLLLPLTDSSDHLIFAVNASFNLNGTDFRVYSRGSSNQDGEIVKLHPGIDTTFQYPVFGNTNNLFSLGEDDAANGWSGFGNFIYQETRYIPNTSNNFLRITF